jgi:flagellar motor switch protein FliM
MSISSPAATYVGTISEPHSQFVLDLSPQLVVFIVERLFGGQGSFEQISRPISVIERKIMKRVVDRIALEISKNWKSLKEFECDFVRFESNPEFVQIVPASEPVIVISMEVKIRGVNSLLNFCYPYIWVSSIISTPEVQDRILFGAKQVSTDEINAVSNSLNSTKVYLKTLLGSSWLRVNEIINLKIGDVIPLNTHISNSIPIYIQNKHTYDGTIGNRSKNYAVRIESIAKGDEHDPH